MRVPLLRSTSIWTLLFKGFLFFSFSCVSPEPISVLSYRPLDFHTKASSFSLPPQKSYSLSQCISLGLERNLLLQAGYTKSSLAKQKAIHYLQKVILPHVRARGGYIFRDNTPGIKQNGFSIPFGDRKKFNGSVSLEMPLWGFGKFWYQYEALEETAQSSQKKVERKEQEIVLAISKLYFQILSLERQGAVLQKSISFLNSQLKQVQSLYRLRLVTHDEVSKVRLQLLLRKHQQQHLLHSETIARNELKRLLHLPLAFPLKLQSIDKPPMWDLSEKSLMEAIFYRPDFQAYRLRLKALQREYQAIYGKFFPTLVGRVEYFYSSDSSLLNQSWLELTLGVEWNLFRGGSRYSQLVQKKQEIQRLSFLYRSQLDQAFYETRKLYLLCKESDQALKIAKEQIELAQETLKKVREKYSQGLVTITDVLREETNLTKSYFFYYQNLYLLYQRLCQLYYTVGKPLEELLEKSFPSKRAEKFSSKNGKEK